MTEARDALAVALHKDIMYPVVGTRTLLTYEEAATAILAALPDGWVLARRQDAEDGAARDTMAAFVAGFRMRHEWPGESMPDLLTMAKAVHATKAIQHKAASAPLECNRCCDEALGILIALGAPPSKTLAAARKAREALEGGEQ